MLGTLGFLLAVALAAAVAGTPAARTARAVQPLMRASGIAHLVPARESILSAAEPSAFAPTTAAAGGEPVKVGPGGGATVTVKAVRRAGAKGAILPSVARPPPGITVKAVSIPADKDEAAPAISAPPQAPAGPPQDVIVAGALRAGKETVAAVAPAIPVQVVAGGGQADTIP